MQLVSMIATRAAWPLVPRRWSGPLPAALALLVIAGAVPGGMGLAAPPCRFSADLEVTIDATGIERLNIEAAEGGLAVHGDADSNQIRVTGKACAKSEAAVQRIQLLSNTEGLTPTSKPRFPPGVGCSGMRRWT